MEDKQQAAITAAVKTILQAVGEDPNRPGLVETPQRVAKMYQEVFAGLTSEFDDYKLFPSHNQGDLVIVKDIAFYSMCEHHLLPFFGEVHIGYYPKGGQVLGLSKFPRLVEYCAKRPSVQEDLTVMIADKLNQHVPNDGIAVVIEASHLCMTMRGVKSPHSRTTTSHYSGRFLENETRKEFLAALK